MKLMKNKNHVFLILVVNKQTNIRSFDVAKMNVGEWILECLTTQLECCLKRREVVEPDRTVILS